MGEGGGRGGGIIKKEANIDIDATSGKKVYNIFNFERRDFLWQSG